MMLAVLAVLLAIPARAAAPVPEAACPAIGGCSSQVPPGDGAVIDDSVDEVPLLQVRPGHATLASAIGSAAMTSANETAAANGSNVSLLSDVCCATGTSMCTGPFKKLFHTEKEANWSCSKGMNKSVCFNNIRDDSSILWVTKTLKDGLLYARQAEVAYVWSFVSEPGVYLFTITSEALKALVTDRLSEDDTVEFNLTWGYNKTRNLTRSLLFDHELKTPIRCSKRNIVRIAYGVQCGLEKSLDIVRRCDEEPDWGSEDLSGCKDNWNLTRFSRTDIDDQFVAILCDMGFEGFFAKKIRMTQNKTVLEDHMNYFGSDKFILKEYQDAEAALCSPSLVQNGKLTRLINANADNSGTEPKYDVAAGFPALTDPVFVDTAASMCRGDHQCQVRIPKRHAHPISPDIDADEYIAKKYPGVPLAALLCHSLEKLRAWHDAQLDRIFRFVPHPYQSLLSGDLEQEFWENVARIKREHKAANAKEAGAAAEEVDAGSTKPPGSAEGGSAKQQEV